MDKYNLVDIKNSKDYKEIMSEVDGKVEGIKLTALIDKLDSTYNGLNGNKSLLLSRWGSDVNEYRLRLEDLIFKAAVLLANVPEVKRCGRDCPNYDPIEGEELNGLCIVKGKIVCKGEESVCRKGV